MQETSVRFLGQEDPLTKNRLPTPRPFLGFPRGWCLPPGNLKVRQLDGINNSMEMSFSKLRELVMDREAWHAAIYGIAKRWTQLKDWSELNKLRTRLINLFSSACCWLAIYNNTLLNWLYNSDLWLYIQSGISSKEKQKIHPIKNKTKENQKKKRKEMWHYIQ